MNGVIFDIQRFAVHDGPGIRTTVFLKGCSARCGWCHNPESRTALPQLQFYPDRCARCGKCGALCGNAVHGVLPDGHDIDRSRCVTCGKCAEECFRNALAVSGKEIGVPELMRRIMEDKPYYEESGGGVTLSGGEPALQADFCLELLNRCREEGINTAMQTAGFYPFGMLERLLPALDLIMYDIKGVSPGIYKEHIGADPALALGNLVKLDGFETPYIVRTPCVSGVNDSDEEMEAIALFLSGLRSMLHYELIPYHGLGKVKYDILAEGFREYGSPSRERMAELGAIAARRVKVIAR